MFTKNEIPDLTIIKIILFFWFAVSVHFLFDSKMM